MMVICFIISCLASGMLMGVAVGIVVDMKLSVAYGAIISLLMALGGGITFVMWDR